MNKWLTYFKMVTWIHKIYKKSLHNYIKLYIYNCYLIVTDIWHIA